MTDHVNKNEPVTAVELGKLMEHLLEYGEYDQYHDWSLYYTLRNKTDALAKMLENWEITEIEGRKLILQFIHTLIKDAGGNTQCITDTLITYAHLPEVNSIITASIDSIFFSLSLLISMKQFQIKSDEWIVKICDFSAGRKFTEKKKNKNIVELYQKIQELILELN